MENPAPAREHSRLYWMVVRQLFFIKQRLFYLLSSCLPDNASGGSLRASLLRVMGAKVGSGCNFRSGLIIQEGFQNIAIGNCVFINVGCCLDGSAPLRIGDNVQIAFQSTLITGGHKIGESSSRAGAMNSKPISIGAGTWIGARAVILPGVTIGNGCVVGAAAVVTKSFEADILLVGFPARIKEELATSTSIQNL